MICYKKIRFSHCTTFDTLSIDTDHLEIIKEYPDGEVFCKYQGEFCFIKN